MREEMCSQRLMIWLVSGVCLLISFSRHTRESITSMPSFRGRSPVMAPFRMRCSAEIRICLALATLTVVSVMAQDRTYPEIGRTPTADEIKKWDIAIGPSGKELPPGSGNVMQGMFFYITKHCIVCHGTELEGTQYGPRLAGGFGTLATPVPVRTVGSYWPF